MKSVENLNKILQEGNFVELSYLLGNKKEMFTRNFLAGISRGIGIGIGVTVISAILIIILQKIINRIQCFQAGISISLIMFF